MTLPRPRSSVVFDGPDRAFARAYMKGIGFGDDDLSRPTVGIANTWIEAMPCNFHLRGLAEHVKEGVREAGGTPYEFNSIAISDGITMGTEGMKTSLISREVIADSIELTARGYQFDAIVAMSGCDKTIPGCVMALARLDIPGVMLYGGSIAPGRWRGHDVTIQDGFGAIGAHAAGTLSDDDLHELEDFERISRATPLLADLKPSGRFVATDLYKAGGVGVLAKRLAEVGVLHRDALTVTGRTIGEEADAAEETPGQQVVRPVSEPIKPEGGFAIMRGNLAP